MYIKTSEYIICLNTDPSKHKLTESGHSTLNRDSGTRYECRTHKVKGTRLQCSNVYSKLALPNITHWICLPFPCPSLAPSNHTCQYHSGINELLKWAKLAHSIHTAVTKQSELLCLFFVHFKASPASWYFWTGLQTGMTVLFIWSVCLSLSAWLLQRSTNTDNAKQYCTVPFLPTNTTWLIHTYICTVHIHTHACTCMDVIVVWSNIFISLGLLSLSLSLSLFLLMTCFIKGNQDSDQTTSCHTTITELIDT